MAFATNELFQSAAGLGSGLRVFPSSVQPKTFVGGTVLLPKLTPIAMLDDLSGWVPWDALGGAAGSAVIRGFVWPDEVQLVSGSEVLGQVMMGGRIHVDDVDLSQTPGPETVADLKIAMRLGLRERGYVVEGLDNFH